jgi:mRNA interferase HigB
MRIITAKRIIQYGLSHADARAWLAKWVRVVEQAGWRSIQDVRRVFRSADAVRVASGRVATVFNVRGNNYRLIVAIHYNTQRVYVLRFLTHAEYDADAWKGTL